jgi:RHS repeat-associated protein
MTVPSGSFEYVYDAIGRQTGITNPCGETTRWGYYNNNWLSSQTDYNASGSVVLSTSYEYDGRGFLTDLLNATSTGSVLCEFGSTNPTYELTYDAVGNCSAMSVSYPVSPGYSGTTDYAYDSRDELTQESSTRNSRYDDTSAYDNAENPTTLRGAAVPAANADNQISTSSSVYDGAGNPTTYAGNSLTFDTENRMTAYGSVLSCGYNIDDLRAWKRNSAGTTYFLYDQFRSVCEMNSSGAVTATNTEGNTGLVSRNASGNSVFYTFDPPGSTQCVLNSAGSVVTSSMNDAFGETAGSVASPYGFGGQQGYFTDMETGLLLLTGRYYDPGVGRFLTRDPSGDRGGINLYAYCHNNPTNLSDPFGTEPVNPVIGGIDCLESIGASIAQGTGVSCSAVGACVGTAVALAMIALLPELSGAAACLIGIIGSAVGDLAAGICDCLTGAPMPNGCEAAFDMMNAIMGCFVGIFLQWIPKSAIEAGLEIALDTTLHIVGMGEAAGC